MNKIKLIDVTLRDGGHCSNFYFEESFLLMLFYQLENSGVDYIEVGYRNGFLNQSSLMGKAAYCDFEFLNFCRSHMKKSQLCVMAHPSLIKDSDLKEMKLCGVALLRLCVGVTHCDNLESVIESCQRYQLAFSINFTHASQYEKSALYLKIEKIIGMGANLIYLADSNGSLMPERVETLFSYLQLTHSVSLGYHAHNNIGLSQTNTLCAIDNGVSYIDASLNGIGKGGGNLQMEKFVAYLYALGNRNYNLNNIINAYHLVAALNNSECIPVPTGEFFRGIDDLSTAQLRLKQENHPLEFEYGK